jgi:hypothetical protein
MLAGGGYICQVAIIAESMEVKGLGRDAARYPGSGADLSANAKKRASTLIRSAPHLV